VEGIVDALRGYGYERVPTADRLRKARWGSKTVHMYQKDMDSCRSRVAASM